MASTWFWPRSRIAPRHVACGSPAQPMHVRYEVKHTSSLRLVQSDIIPRFTLVNAFFRAGSSLSARSDREGTACRTRSPTRTRRHHVASRRWSLFYSPWAISALRAVSPVLCAVRVVRCASPNSARLLRRGALPANLSYEVKATGSIALPSRRYFQIDVPTDRRFCSRTSSSLDDVAHAWFPLAAFDDLFLVKPVRTTFAILTITRFRVAHYQLVTRGFPRHSA